MFFGAGSDCTYWDDDLTDWIDTLLAECSAVSGHHDEGQLERRTWVAPEKATTTGESFLEEGSKPGRLFVVYGSGLGSICKELHAQGVSAVPLDATGAVQGVLHCPSRCHLDLAEGRTSLTSLMRDEAVRGVMLIISTMTWHMGRPNKPMAT